VADPTKPVDRNRPFKRINNDEFIPSTAPDGHGVKCGCQTEKSFGDPGKEFTDFILNKVPLLKAINTALDVLGFLLNPTKLVDVFIDFLENDANVPAIFAEPLRLLLKLPASLLGFILTPAKVILDTVRQAVKIALNAVADTLARRTLPRAIRVIPQWVAVKVGASNKSVTKDQIIEVEGICTRSYGNPVDVPFFNWHTWFSWNIQVTPEPQYINVRSKDVGNPPAQIDDPPNKEGIEPGERTIIKNGTFEIQWDAGAMFGAEGRQGYVGGFPDTDSPKHDGPMLETVSAPEVGTTVSDQVLWPMAGMFVWASGRHVYDCSRVTDRNSDDPLMCALIHPARAIATARFVAITFEETAPFSVPAVEFLFMASRRGGYINHDAMADSDYEFILDLPPLDFKSEPYPIGSTEKFPHNTILLRPRLLKDLRFLTEIDTTKGEPILEPIRPDDPAKPPTQVKITIPKSVLSSDAYGIRLRLGWFDDAEQTQAKKVKLCTLAITGMRLRLTTRDDPGEKVRKILKNEEKKLKKDIDDKLKNFEVSIDVPIPGFPPIRFKPLDNDLFGPLIRKAVADAITAFIDAVVGLLPSESEEEWLFRMGVNGMWVTMFFKPKKRDEPPFLAFQLGFDVRLTQGDPLLFAAHGLEFDPVGDIMHSSIAHRTMTLRGVPVPWEKIVNPDSKEDRKQLVFDYALRTMVDTSEGIDKISLGFDNEPLGLIDPAPDNAGFSQQNNPMIIRDNFEPIQTQRIAHFAHKLDDVQAICVEDTGLTRTGFPTKPDYEIRYTLKISDQIPNANT
jgi:hypothetical protein